MLKVTIEGLDQLKQAGDKSIEWKELMKSKVAEEVRFFGEAVVGTSRERYLSGRPGLNVVTGRLRSSINYSVKKTDTGFSLDVGTNVIYAATHEFGSKDGFIRPRPFLKPAVEDEYGKFTDNLEAVLQQFTEGGLGQ